MVKLKKVKFAESFDLFLEEVRLTYGQEIAGICWQMLSECASVDVADPMAILDAAKRRAGFRPELSSLSAASLRFCS